MLNASKAGYIKMNKLYSTIGENGINEATELYSRQVKRAIKHSINDDDAERWMR